MGFRMRKSINLGGGVRVNLSKKGVGYSVGTKGYRVTKKAGGGIRTTASLPGTGISYVKETGSGKRHKASRSTGPAVTEAQPNKKSHLTAADRRNPEKALQKYENCLQNRMKVVTTFVICCAVFALAGLQLFAVILLLLAVITYASKRTWENNIQELDAILLNANPPAEHEAVDDQSQKEKTVCAQDKPALQESQIKAFDNFRVAGTSYHEHEIEELGYENPDYEMSKSEIVECGREDERIYKLNFAPTTVELVPEPENPHDPKAIMVLVDGSHVGYIKKGSTSRVRNLLSAGGKVSAEISGGKYKEVYLDEEQDKYQTEYGSTSYSVVISITK